MAIVVGTNSGFVSSSPSADPGGSDNYTDGKISATKDTTSSGGTITEMGWWCADESDAQNFEVGIYDHDSSGDAPKDIIGSSGNQTKGTGIGWEKVVGLNISVTGSTIYWLAIQLDETTPGTEVDYGSVNGYRITWSGLGKTTFDNPWDDPSAYYDDYAFAIYAVYGESPSDPSTSINIGDSMKSVSGAWLQVADAWKVVSGAWLQSADSWKIITLP